MGARKKSVGTVAELFAGVGGFRCGLEPSGWHVAWSNQWEPGRKVQYASDCYVRQFGDAGHVCDDIEKVVASPDAKKAIPRIDLLVGGFPCQDYSVAKPLPQATGIRGKKGVLWWSIYKFLELKKPKYVLLENVDRLLKSPSNQRGRDFAVILSCFARLGYAVEWRVINAADYGFPQRRRRVFIYAERGPLVRDWGEKAAWKRIDKSGVFARAFPIEPDDAPIQLEIRDAPAFRRGFEVDSKPFDPYRVSEKFGSAGGASLFENAGVMFRGEVWTRKVVPVWTGDRTTLGDIVGRTTREVPEEFFLPDAAVEAWTYLKGAKREQRVEKGSGFEYWYSEGGVAFPDPLDRPSRTILTGEGGTSPSRFKHVVHDPRYGRLRRLLPEELEELNGFDRGWTEGMPDAKRAFMMGNALVVGIIQRLGKIIAGDIKAKAKARAKANAVNATKAEKAAKMPAPSRNGRKKAA